MAQAAAYAMVGCQAVIAVTLGRAAATKVTGREAFGEFRRWLVVGVRVPPRVARPVAVAAVAAEAVTAVAMVLPAAVPAGPGAATLPRVVSTAAVPAGFGAATLLLAVFTAAIAVMWRRRTGVPCRCFGAGRHPPGLTHLVRNAALLSVAAGGGLLSWAGITSAPLDPVGALAAVAGATAALLLVELEEIVEVIRPRHRLTSSADRREGADVRRVGT